MIFCILWFYIFFAFYDVKISDFLLTVMEAEEVEEPNDQEEVFEVMNYLNLSLNI